MNLRTISEAVEAYKQNASVADAARLDFFEGLFRIQQQRAGELAEQAVYQGLSGDLAVKAYFDDEPMLAQAPVSIESEAFARTCTLVAAHLAEGAGLDEGASAALSAFDWAAFCGKVDLAQAGGNPPQFVEDCLQDFDRFGIDSALPASIVMMCVSFSLRAHLQAPAQALFAAVPRKEREGSRLRPVNCPVCGSPAALSHVTMQTGIDGRKREQYCSLCGTTWPYDRMRCGVCGVDNPARLHYFHVEGDESHRLQNCDECGQYQRVLFEDDLAIPVSLEVEDVVMAKLDRIALDPRFRAR